MPGLPILYRIPVCPFSQRIEILLALKELTGAVWFETVDITRPRDPALLAKTRGTSALPIVEVQQGTVLKESLLILTYFDEVLGQRRIRQAHPLRHAVENMLIAKEGPFTTAGYILVMNRDPGARAALTARLLRLYRELSAFLSEHNPDGTFLFEEFGLAEAVFTPIFMRFWFLDYYEGFRLPETAEYTRVARWRQACLEHPAAQQVKREEIVKLYYDYAMGAGNGALPHGRSISSFAFAPHWQERPWPPADKYVRQASDRELGLV